MINSTVSQRIDRKVAERAMLSHPFYQAWTEGRLPIDTLRAYSRQYFHHVEAFPRAVSAVHSLCPDRDGRRMLRFIEEARPRTARHHEEHGHGGQVHEVADAVLRARRRAS